MRDKNNFLIFGSPLIEEEEIDEVLETLKSGWIGTGPKVARFEELFREYKKAKYAIALGSCTAALHLSLLAAGIGKDDEVITTPMTFCATINAIIHSGATPVLADCDRHTMNIDPAEILKKITKKTKAILPVHFAGRPCNMDEICDIAKEHNIKIIEDCAHAIEGEYKNRKTGTFGEMGCFSFYVTKNIITAEGGMVITNNEEYANKIKVLALHGMSKDAWKRFSDEGFKHYEVISPGFKYNMTDLQASLGIHQIKRIDKYWERRKEIWERYNSALSDLHIELPSPIEANTKHSLHLYTILIDKKRCGLCRDEFLKRMTDHNIGIGVHYRSIPTHRYYRETYGWKPEDYSNSFYIGETTVSLPLSPKLTETDVDDVISTLRQILC
ncbi:MAG: DegT/DnrJ/EryC1/StrS family aminotransferase [Candidatus Hydrogenedentota bacterium]